MQLSGARQQSQKSFYSPPCALKYAQLREAVIDLGTPYTVAKTWLEQGCELGMDPFLCHHQPVFTRC